MPPAPSAAAESSPTGHPFPWRQPSVLILTVLCLLVTGFSLTYFSWHLFTEKHRPLVRGIDNNYYFFWLPAALIDHDLDFNRQLARSPSLPKEDRDAELAEPLTAAGHRANKFPLGWALASAPWFEAAHLFSRACGWPTTGWEPPYQIALWLGQLCYAWLGLWFAWRVLVRLFPPRESALALLLTWLASPLVYYQTAGLSMTHSQVFALVAAAVWLGGKIAEDPRTRWYAALGFVSGLLFVTRFTAVVYLLIPALPVATAWRREPAAPRRLSALAAILAGASPPVFLQLLAWKFIYGTWFVYSYDQEGFHFTDPHLWDVLFSPLHGFFYWHPLMAVGLAGVALWGIANFRHWPWLAAFFLVYVLNASWWCWWFGGSFGGRSFEGCVLLVMTGLAWLFVAAKKRPKLHAALFALASLAAVWNVALLALFLSKRIPSETAVTWPAMWQALWKSLL